MVSKKFFVILTAMTLLFSGWKQAKACTGITLMTKDSMQVVARTIEWGGGDLNSCYVIVPRGYRQQSYTPDGVDGMVFTTRYGYVGLAVEQKEFVAEGLNEAGLSGGLFYFPGYGRYETFDSSEKSTSVADLQLVSFILGSCSTIEEVKEAVEQIHVIGIDPRASTVHWRFAEESGRQVVLEIINGTVHFYENELGVLTNSPGFEWQMTNLNNYVNLYSGSAPVNKIGRMNLASFGAGSGFLGMPGDITPPSRFVRAAFYQSTAPRLDTAEETVRQCFQILNSFDIPIGIEFSAEQTPADIPSGTQWTSATDLMNRKIYYRTMYNSMIRCIDLKKIDFSRVKYRAVPLDGVKEQPITEINIR